MVALCIRVKALSYVNVNRDFAWSLLHIWMNCIELSMLLWGVEAGSGIDHWLRRGKYGEQYDRVIDMSFLDIWFQNQASRNIVNLVYENIIIVAFGLN